MFLTLIEITLVALLMAGWISQVVLPVLRETPLFPLFRRETIIKHMLLKAEQRLVEELLEQELQAKQDELNELQSTNPHKEGESKCEQ